MVKKIFSIININTNKKISFYIQGQQRAARVLFLLCLLYIGSLEGTLAMLKPCEIEPATTASYSICQGRCRLAEPVAKRDEACSSSGQQPAINPNSAIIASSTAAPSVLEQLMSGRIPDNHTLVSALNAATSQEQAPWLEAAIQWFSTQQIKALTPAATRDYAALAHIRVTPTNSKLLQGYFHSLCDKVQQGSSGEELPIQALAYALAHLAPSIFEGDAQPLLDLGTYLLEKLHSSQRLLKQANDLSARATLEALSQTLLLVHEVAPQNLNIQEGSLYQSFQSCLQKIADRAQYYPIIYHVRILKQTLHLLASLKGKHKSNLRRVLQGLLGAANLVAVGQGLTIRAPQPTELQEDIIRLKSAWQQQQIAPPPWYSELLKLEEAMCTCLECKNFASYINATSCNVFVKDMPSQNRAFAGCGTINQDQQALRYGIAMQLSILALAGLTPQMRQSSIDTLIALGHSSAWGSDTNVLTGLLNSLALVAAQDQVAREAEATKAQNALKDLTKPKNSMLKRWGHPHSAQKKLAAKRQLPQGQTTQQAPGAEKRLISHVKGILRIPNTKMLRAQEIENLSQLSNYIATTLAKPSHFVQRPIVTEQLSQTLATKGVCVLHGLDGSGKSTLAAFYGHTHKGIERIWIDAEDSRKLQEAYQQLAQKLQVAYQSRAKQLAAEPSQYRQELAKMVYQALEKCSQSTLLILDNAQDASLIEDYLLHRPATIQVIVTTRSAETFEGKHEQLQLGPFSQDQGQHYLEARFQEMKISYNQKDISGLLKKVGLVPQQLELAVGYLQANQMAKTAQYITRLQALKRAGNKQQNKLALPEVALSLKQLTKEGQQLMQYAAYLDGYFIPLSLVSILLGEDDLEKRSQVVRDLSRRSLLQVVSTQEGKELGLQVHRKVQASCREYKDWSPEAALGTRETILSELAKVLKVQMPWVEVYPDDSWQQGKLYAPHVATVVTALKDSGTVSSALVANLLELMAQYSRQVRRNYHEAESCYEAVMKILYTHFQDGFDHLDLTQVFRNWANIWLELGDPARAMNLYCRALSMYPDNCNEALDYLLDQALTFENLGSACRALGDLHKTVHYYNRALQIYERVYLNNPNHPEIARILSNLGYVSRDLRAPFEAINYYERTLKIVQKLYVESHPYVVGTLHDLGCMYHVAALTLKQDRYESPAQEYLQQANASFAQAIATCSPIEVGLCVEYGNFLLNIGETYQAHQYLHRAIEHGDDGEGLNYTLLEKETVTSILQAYISQQQKVSLIAMDYAYYLMIHHYRDFQEAGIAMTPTREAYLKAYQASLGRRKGRPEQAQADRVAYYLLGSLYEAQGDYEAAATAFARIQDGIE